MSWHMHKNIVMLAVNLFNEFAWAQEKFDAGGWWETSNLIVVALSKNLQLQLYLQLKICSTFYFNGIINDWNYLFSLML